MSRPETREEAMRNGFYVQLGIFLAVGAAFIALTLWSGGDFWWWPVMVIWGLSVAGYGAWAYWIIRRGRWEDETQKQRQRFFAPPNPLE